MRTAAIRRRPALVAALAVFAVGALALGLAQHPTPLPLARGKAIQAARHSPFGRRALRSDWTSISVTPIDSHMDRVSFFEGRRALAQVAVNRQGEVVQAIDFRGLSVPYGAWIAYLPGMLIGLSALFVLMAGVAPVRRMRNLDVLASISLLAPVVLLQRRYVDASVLAAVPGLGYLMIRCLRRAFGSPAPAGPSVPLLDLLTADWEGHRRVRLLRFLFAVLALVFLMVSVSSTDAVDVIYAVMEGATKLVGGVLPYGHMPGDVIHGDTYPLLSYGLYVPIAWLSPVQSVWDSVDIALGVTAMAALGTAWAVFRAVAGRRRERGATRSPEREAAGLRGALTWLSFPPLLISVSSGTTDVVLAAVLVLALLLWRRPAIATGLLAAGAWFKLAPAALLPVRLAPLRGRDMARSLAAIVLVSAPLVALLIVLGGSDGPTAMLHAMSYQLSRGSPQSLWAALGISWLQPVGQAVVLAMVAGAAVRLRREPELADDRVRMAALTGAILIALQLAANYWAFLYLVWVMPAITVALLTEPEQAPVPVRVAVRARLPAEVGPAGATA